MTTIIAVETADDVLLGWDGRVTRANEAYDDMIPKVFIRHGVIYAVAGMTRMADIIQYADFPEYDGSDARRWLVTEWVPVFRDAIVADPVLYDKEEGTLAENALLIVLDGQVFHFDSTLSPTTVREGIYGLGSGSDYAKGGLFLLKHVVDDVEFDCDDMMIALEVATQIDPYSGGTLTVTTANSMIRSEAF